MEKRKTESMSQAQESNCTSTIANVLLGSINERSGTISMVQNNDKTHSFSWKVGTNNQSNGWW